MGKSFRILIKNYKNILQPNCDHEHNDEPIPIVIEQNKLNLIVGNNNIGKTNMLRAISKLSLISSQTFFNLCITKTSMKYDKRFDKDNDKPRFSSYETIDENKVEWSFQLSLDLPNDVVYNLIQKSGEFQQDEIKNCKSSIDKFKVFSVIFSGKLNGNGNNTWFSTTFDDQQTIQRKHMRWITEIFFNSIVESYYPKIVNLLDNHDFADLFFVPTSLSFTRQDFDKKSSTFEFYHGL